MLVARDSGLIPRAISLTQLNRARDLRELAVPPGNRLERPGALAYGITQEEAVARAQALALRVLADRMERGNQNRIIFRSAHAVGQALFVARQQRYRERAHRMTEMLKKAFDAASRLPPANQDVLGAMWLADVAADLRWDQTLDESAESLSALGDKALEEDRAGSTMPARS